VFGFATEQALLRRLASNPRGGLGVSFLQPSQSRRSNFSRTKVEVSDLHPSPHGPLLYFEKRAADGARRYSQPPPPQKNDGGFHDPPSRYSRKTLIVGGGYWSFFALSHPSSSPKTSPPIPPLPSRALSLPIPQEGPLRHMAYYHGEPAPLAAHGHHPQGPAPRCLRSYMRVLSLGCAFEGPGSAQASF